MSSYTISTLIQATQSQEFTVQRRFKDFVWLHNCFIEHFPGVLIPPLPKKDFFCRFDEEFIQSRIRGLEAFLSRILRHPLLHQQSFVQSFLQEDNIEVSYTNYKLIQNNQSIKRTESVASWFETKLDEFSISKQDVIISFIYIFLSFLSTSSCCSFLTV